MNMFYDKKTNLPVEVLCKKKGVKIKNGDFLSFNY